MKIEVAPWIKDYVVDMEELYTELALEKVRNKPTGRATRILKNYKEMFDMHDSVKRSDQFRHVSKSKGVVKKILIKGDPGIGKTTLIKKITWDWATGTFTQFIIVLVVFLKLVKPGESIENVIIKQRPELEGMNITQKKLGVLLETFGNRCLLILDGLDEHALGENEDVLKIIRGQKLLYCNVIISSRPHSIKEIDKYFQTVVKVNGFTRGEAEKFAFKILEDDRKVQDILNYSPVDFKEGINLFNFPILLSFMCLLVREEDIDLSNRSLASGEIYMRMVRCLYKKFTIRTGRVYKDSEFIEILTKLGKLAFETLLSGNPLLQRREISENIGEDAFKYGLLIGYEDGFLLLNDVTADILITFPHRSIQEFLGAFYFIAMLNKGKGIDSLLGIHCKKPIFMMNPLFLHFCLWLVRPSSYFQVRNSRTVYEAIRGYILKRIDFVQLRLHNISVLYPALNFPEAPEMKDKITVAFLEDLLANCQQTGNLLIQNFESINWTLTALHHILPRITSVDVSHKWINRICTMSSSDSRHSDASVEITMDGYHDMAQTVGDVIKFITSYTKKEISLIIVLDSRFSSEIELCQFFHKDLKKICITDRWNSKIVFNGYIPLCPSLTHLSMLGTRICCRTTKRISAFAHHGLLPKLQHLSFAFSRIDLPIIPTWNTLTSLDWSNHPINIEEIYFLPNLESLSIYARCITSPFELTLKQLPPKLTHLAIFDMTPTQNNAFIQVLSQGYLDNLKSLKISNSLDSKERQVLPWSLWTEKTLQHLALTGFLGLYLKNLSFFVLYELDISHSRGITGNLSRLFWSRFPSLHTLILSDCALNSQDLCSLVKSKAQGKLPELRSLDISQNDGFFNILRSNVDVRGFKDMKSDEHPSHEDKSHSLQHLEKLTISVCEKDLFTISTNWPYLEQLEIVCLGRYLRSPTDMIVDALVMEKMPRLKRVWYAFEGAVSLVHSGAEKLNRHGIFLEVRKITDRKFFQ